MAVRRNPPTRFAVCIDNTDYPASLETGKLYQVIPDEQAAKLGYLRVIDESGEDYAFEAQRFLLLELPNTTARKLRRRLSTRISHETPKAVRVLRRRRT